MLLVVVVCCCMLLYVVVCDGKRVYESSVDQNKQGNRAYEEN